MKARKVFLASGGTILTELHPDRCWHSEEVSSVEVEVDDDAICDICEERIKEIPDGMVRADGEVLFTFEEAHQALDIGLVSEIECECDTCPRECPNWSPEEDPLEVDCDHEEDLGLDYRTDAAQAGEDW